MKAQEQTPKDSLSPNLAQEAKLSYLQTENVVFLQFS